MQAYEINPDPALQEERTLSVIQRFLDRQFEPPMATPRRSTHACATNASESAHFSVSMHAMHALPFPSMHAPSVSYPAAANLPLPARTSRVGFPLGSGMPNACGASHAPEGAFNFESNIQQPQLDCSTGGGDLGDPGLEPPSEGGLTGIATRGRAALEPLHHGPLTVRNVGT